MIWTLVSWVKEETSSYIMIWAQCYQKRVSHMLTHMRYDMSENTRPFDKEQTETWKWNYFLLASACFFLVVPQRREVLLRCRGGEAWWILPSAFCQGGTCQLWGHVGSCHCADSNSPGLRWGPRFCILRNLSNDADDSCLWTSLWGYILGERKRKFSFFFTCFLISSTHLTSRQQVSKDITSEQCEYRIFLKGGIQLTSENEHLV